LVIVLLCAGCSSHDDDDFAAGDDAADDDVADNDASDDDMADDDTTAQAPYAPVLYPADRTHSPIAAFSADAQRSIADQGSLWQPDVFMKVGDSLTDGSSALHCFADGPVDLGAHTGLQSSLEYFLAGDAAGSTPFDRWSVAAEVGMNAGWALSGTPAPLDAEVAAIAPQFALIQYGTNDMGLGTTHESALWGFYESMTALLDRCTEQGIVPALMGIPHRGDSTVANWWVLTYNDVIRAMAQDRQIPYVDLHRELDVIDGNGLSGDGIHLDAANGGACVLTQEGLEYGNNVRNLAWLETLDRIKAVVVDGAPALDDGGDVLTGDGSPDAPFEIPWLPFSDRRDTLDSDHRNLDLYTGCESDSDESGAEFLYRFEVGETVRVRAIVLDLEGVDIDIHLLDETASEEGCLLRDHHLVESTLEPGIYYFALDTWFDGADELAGEYTFVVTTCHPDDSDCD